MDPTRAVYSKQGELICRNCESSDTIDEGYERAAKSSAYGTLGTGVLSLFFNPFFLLSIAAVIQGVRAIALLNRAEYQTALGAKRNGFMAAAVIGLILGGVVPILRILLIMAN